MVGCSNIYLDICKPPITSRPHCIGLVACIGVMRSWLKLSRSTTLHRPRALGRHHNRLFCSGAVLHRATGFLVLEAFGNAACASLEPASVTSKAWRLKPGALGPRPRACPRYSTAPELRRGFSRAAPRREAAARPVVRLRPRAPITTRSRPLGLAQCWDCALPSILAPSARARLCTCYCGRETWLGRQLPMLVRR